MAERIESMARISDCDNWFEIWIGDKRGILSCMVQNMASDLAAGYNYFGNCITKQREEIEKYQKEINERLDEFKNMDDKQVNRWCFYDIVKRGAID